MPISASRDLERLFSSSQRPLSIKQKIKSWNILALQFLLLFAFFFSILNFPAYYRRIEYFYRTSILKQSHSNPTLAKVEQTIRQVQPLPTIVGVQPKQPERQNPPTQPKPNLANNHLYIPKINVDAPIIWDVPIETMTDALRKGVTHYQGTALPGQNGNAVITGHSSNFWWDTGEYKQIFSLLDKLKPGDRLVATYDNQAYIYEVERTFVVNPNQIEVLNPLDHSVITLLTCTPVGTTINRLIVQARQISPIAGAVGKVPELPYPPSELPSVR